MLNGNVYFNINDKDYGPYGEGEYVFAENKLYIIYLLKYEICIDEFISEEQISEVKNKDDVVELKKLKLTKNE